MYNLAGRWLGENVIIDHLRLSISYIINLHLCYPKQTSFNTGRGGRLKSLLSDRPRAAAPSRKKQKYSYCTVKFRKPLFRVFSVGLNV